MPYKYWKLAAGILCLIPVIGIVGYLLWRVLPELAPAFKTIVASPGAILGICMFVGAAFLCVLFFVGMHFIEQYKSDDEIDEILKKNLGPQKYKEYREYVGIKSRIKRWVHDNSSK